MGRPEVDAVLGFIQDDITTSAADWPGKSNDINGLADIPLERINQDDSINLDKGGNIADLSGEVYDHEEALRRGMNFVAVRSATQSDEPIGTSYDHRTSRVVSLRVEGMSALGGEYGAIDPNAGTGDAVSRGYPTTDWDSLITNIRRAILAKDNRETPSVSGRDNVGFKDLFIENQQDNSAEFGQFYQWVADIRFEGFETLPV